MRRLAPPGGGGVLWDDAGPLFRDRSEAGERLAGLLEDLGPRRGIVLGVPRGGLAVAAPVAARLGWPLDVILARKVGTPFNPELAAGAVAPNGVCRWNADVIRYLFGPAAGPDETRELLLPYLREAQEELERRLRLYRAGRPPLRLAGLTVIVVDDGIATGLTVAAALDWLAGQETAARILATPVASVEAVEYLTPLCDRVVCLATPDPFFAVGQYYADFHQVTDEEVEEILRTHGLPGDLPARGPAGPEPAGR